MLTQQKSRNLDRNARIENQTVSASKFPKSGFDLTYRSYNDFQLGRLHVSGYHHTMPGDKFAGLNRGQFQFNRLVVPNVSPIEVSQHNFYMPYRAVDNTFMDAFAPNKNNNMSAEWRAPSFTLREIFDVLLPTFGLSSVLGQLYLREVTDTNGNRDLILGDPGGIIDIDLTTLESPRNLFEYWSDSYGVLDSSADNFYLVDLFREIVSSVESSLSVSSWSAFSSSVSGYSSNISAVKYMRSVYDSFIRYFLGEGSLLDSFGYNIIRRVDVTDIDAFKNLFWDYVQPTLTYEFTSSNLSDVPLCEYPLRIYYAVWYEYYRDANLEPVNYNTLPRYSQFGSASVVLQYPWMLATRPRCWQHDLHVSSMPDDPFRHVFAPVLTEFPGISEPNVNALLETQNYNFAEVEAQGTYANFPNGNGINLEKVSWLDPSTGSERHLDLPIPAIVSDAISSADSGNLFVANRLDLQTLRRAQALERVLKRNFYFGDEYKDRMFAHYGSVVSDERVNRPAVLSASVTTVSTSQQVASVGTQDTPQGTRNVVVNAGTDDDGYSFFSEEFGMVLNIITFMPVAQYNGLCPQLLQHKVVDFPLPEYATQFSEASRILEVAQSPSARIGRISTYLFGHQPYGHAYRGRTDEVHGSYLSTKANQTFRRFFGMDEEANSLPRLNYLFIHCNPPLDMFENSVRFDGQLYGFIDHMFTVERCLPTPAEEI